MNREFSIGDLVYLRVRAKKSSLKLGSFAKLSPRYCGLFEELKGIGLVVYRLSFPASTRDQKKIHVSFLKKYVHDPNHVINWDVIEVEPKGEFQTKQLHILDKKVTMLMNQAIGQIQVHWKHYGLDEAMWELEDAMRLTHPFLFNFAEHRGQC